MGLGATVVAAIVAGTAWAGQPNDTKRPSQDNQATRGPSRQAPPPANNRQVEREAPPRQAPPQTRRSPEGPSGSSGTRREAPVRRNDGVPATGRTTRRDNSPPVKNGETARLAQGSAGSGKRRIDSANDNGNSGKGVGAGRAPVDRQPPKNIGNRSQGKGTGDGKNLNGSSPGASSAINGVRKRLGGPKDPKNVQPKPGKLVLSDAANRKNGQNNAFQERLKAGNFNRLTAGPTGKKLQLAQQYRAYQKGDVARQLGLQTRGAHQVMYRGVVSPAYRQQSMKYRYWGPSFFAGVCWYPTWASWVKWSWYHHCKPYWDPRPIWCRPIYYRPCSAWVYWNPPVWTPLPEAACGTWVDVPPAEMPASDADLQLLAVRFVDPGHPEEQLGPRYRVWFRNNGTLPVTQPFNVMLFAGNAAALAPDMLQAGVRVTGIDAGDVQSVDIRLPVEVYTMQRDVRGNSAPFSVLQVLVDANREVAETTDVNNGARLAPAAILPVDPASFELQPGTAKPGEEVLLAGEGLGPQPGRILIQVNGREMDGVILGWYDLGVRWTAPRLALNAPVEADVVVIRGDGAAANPVKITLTP